MTPKMAPRVAGPGLTNLYISVDSLKLRDPTRGVGGQFGAAGPDDDRPWKPLPRRTHASPFGRQWRYPSLLGLSAHWQYQARFDPGTMVQRQSGRVARPHRPLPPALHGQLPARAGPERHGDFFCQVGHAEQGLNRYGLPGDRGHAASAAGGIAVAQMGVLRCAAQVEQLVRCADDVDQFFFFFELVLE